MNDQLKRYGRLLVAYLKPQRRRARLLAIVLLGSIVLQLINPQILRHFIDSVMNGGTLESLITTAILFLVAGLANNALSIYATYLGSDVGWTATNLLRKDLATHCLSLDMPFHNNRTPGELIERIDGDITAMSNFFSQFVVRILGGAVLLTGTLILLFAEDWRVGTVLALFVVITFIVLNRFQQVAIPATTAEREAVAEFYGFLEERLAGVDDIRANGAGPFVMRRLYEIGRQLFILGRKAQMMRTILWVIIIGFFSLGEVAALGMGVYLFKAGAITLGTVYLFFQYTEVLQGPLEQISLEIQDLQKAGASIARVEELLREKRTMVDGDELLPEHGALSVTFDHVMFGYADGVPVLNDLSFELKPDTVLGLLGRTGSGKSSLTRLLFRLYDPLSGSLKIGGVDTRAADPRQLRRRVAMVTQEVQLFHATVRDNLTFFDTSIPDVKIIQVIRDLGMDGWYESLPNGLDSELRAGGGGLSAGEAQLLAFTRVFLKDPGLVILDEPSSRMDMATEAMLERAMAKLMKGRTVIIIAHRLSTVARADEIMVLEHGRIREHGRRETLERDTSSHFHHLLQTGLEKEIMS
ncbi:MAG: transporter related protein [Chlorobi bacterium]|nr:transporter related protein [Chlorobiota bacterium]